MTASVHTVRAYSRAAISHAAATSNVVTSPDSRVAISLVAATSKAATSLAARAATMPVGMATGRARRDTTLTRVSP